MASRPSHREFAWRLHRNGFERNREVITRLYRRDSQLYTGFELPFARRALAAIQISRKAHSGSGKWVCLSQLEGSAAQGNQLRKAHCPLDCYIQSAQLDLSLKFSYLITRPDGISQQDG